MVKMKREQVRYLCFEGGVARGFAYIGAIRKLESLNIIPYAGYLLNPYGIRGISGASAGAITAMLLSSGYNSNEIDLIMGISFPTETQKKQEKEPDIFDLIPGTIPVIPQSGKPASRTKGSAPEDQPIYIMAMEMAEIFLPDEALAVFGIKKSKSLIQLEKKLAKFYTEEKARRLIFLASIVGEVIMWKLKKTMPKQMANIYSIDNNREKIFYSLISDWGIFTGLGIRAFLNKWLTIARYRVGNQEEQKIFDKKNERLERLKFLSESYDRECDYAKKHSTIKGSPTTMGKRNKELTTPQTEIGETIYSMAQDRFTFKQHNELFQVKLAVTSSNLETFKSHVFSSQTTPNFPVVDAVRMSMSMPFIFKPIVLHDEEVLSTVDKKDEKGTYILRGVWVDGGLFNNTPLNVFDGDYDCKQQPFTLGLRLGLEDDEGKEIKTLGDFFAAYLGLLVGTGESLVSPTYKNTDQCIVIEPTGLDRFNFFPDQTARDTAAKSAEKAVEDYFAEHIV